MLTEMEDWVDSDDGEEDDDKEEEDVEDGMLSLVLSWNDRTVVRCLFGYLFSYGIC